MDQKEPLSRTAVIERRRSGAAVLPGKARHVLALCSRTAAAGVCILGLSLAGGQAAEASGQYGKAAIIGGLTSVGIGFVGSIMRGEQPTSGEIVKNAGVGAVGGVVGRTMNDRNWNGAIAGGVVAGVGNEIYRAQTRPKGHRALPGVERAEGRPALPRRDRRARRPRPAGSTGNPRRRAKLHPALRRRELRANAEDGASPGRGTRWIVELQGSAGA